MQHGNLVHLIAFISVIASTATVVVVNWTLFTNLWNNDNIQDECLEEENNLTKFKSSLLKALALVGCTSLCQLIASSVVLGSTSKEEWTRIWSWMVLTALMETVTLLCFINVSSYQSKLSRDCSFIMSTLATLYLNEFYFILIIFCLVHALAITLLMVVYGVRNFKEKEYPFHLLNV